MASEYSFDVVSDFDFQELRNAVDQVTREITTRYDFKGVDAEIELNDDDITILGPDNMKVKAISDVLLQKVINRKLSPKILEMKEPEPAGGATIKQIIKLVKVMDQETCKMITKVIKEQFPKVKGSIQGTVVRVSSKDKDSLQMVMNALRILPNLKVPITFTNYR